MSVVNKKSSIVALVTHIDEFVDAEWECIEDFVKYGDCFINVAYPIEWIKLDIEEDLNNASS
jgi:hypothetical protein